MDARDVMWQLHDLLEESEEHYVYAGYRDRGSLLVKELATERRLLFTAWETGKPTGKARIEDALDRLEEFRGHRIDCHIFVSQRFTRSARSLVGGRQGKLVLLEVDEEEGKLTSHSETHIPEGFRGVLTRLSEIEEVDLQATSLSTQVLPSDATGDSTVPTAFVSYSRDSREHVEWVVKLASDLRRNGIDTILDEWNLMDYGGDLHLFMEAGVRDSAHVVTVCTPRYAERADARVGGVGVESTVITGEFYDKMRTRKYVSVVREYERELKDSLPSYLKSRYAIDFSSAGRYAESLEELLRWILGRPKHKKPRLGNLPDFQ